MFRISWIERIKGIDSIDLQGSLMCFQLWRHSVRNRKERERERSGKNEKRIVMRRVNVMDVARLYTNTTTPQEKETYSLSKEERKNQTYQSKLK